jgi:hypothetical protein
VDRQERVSRLHGHGGRVRLAPDPGRTPSCQCTIATYVGKFGGSRCQTEWDFTQLENEYQGDPTDPTIIVHFLVTVWCWDGSMYQAECTILFEPPDPDFWYEWVVAQLEAEANDIAYSNCPPMTEECLGVS